MWVNVCFFKAGVTWQPPHTSFRKPPDNPDGKAEDYFVVEETESQTRDSLTAAPQQVCG